MGKRGGIKQRGWGWGRRADQAKNKMGNPLKVWEKICCLSVNGRQSSWLVLWYNKVVLQFFSHWKPWELLWHSCNNKRGVKQSKSNTPKASIQPQVCFHWSDAKHTLATANNNLDFHESIFLNKCNAKEWDAVFILAMMFLNGQGRFLSNSMHSGYEMSEYIFTVPALSQFTNRWLQGIKISSDKREHCLIHIWSMWCHS